jgi:hypothetical protein
MRSIRSFAEELNGIAKYYAIGRLQSIRREIKSLKRRAGNLLFSDKTIFDEWAYHHGGRTELQFNIGFDGTGDKSAVKSLRYGLAFSFETNRSMPDISLLEAKVPLFNEFLLQYPRKYAGMQMWNWNKAVRSKETNPAPIPNALVRPGVFVFLGLIQPVENADSESILCAFDDLLPLYQYVESNGKVPLADVVPGKPFDFRSGAKFEKLSTKANKKAEIVDVALKHNAMQAKLIGLLSEQHGDTSVTYETNSGNGSRVDVVLKQDGGYSFYEIKPYPSPRACIREAIGQLLEYSHWTGGIGASRLIIVGPSELDADGKVYLDLLRTKYSLPIEYLSVPI